MGRAGRADERCGPKGSRVKRRTMNSAKRHVTHGEGQELVSFAGGEFFQLFSTLVC